MEIIKILYSKLLQEKAEKELLLEHYLNMGDRMTPNDIMTFCKGILITIAELDSAIITLDKYIGNTK